jgi:branched-chain amino acid transport system permease protein
MYRGWLALAAALLLFPWLVAGSDSAAFLQDMGALVLLAAIGASAWNILGGYAGQISVGHAMFYGAGAYLPLLLYQQWHLPPLAGVPLGVGVSLLLALVVGLPTFRLQGHYFSMATIAVAELIRIVVSNWDFLGGAIGLQGPAVSVHWWDLTFRSAVPYYYIFLGVLAALLLVTWHMQRSRLGYYLRAVRAGERPARSLGVPVRRYKLYALMLSATFTSLAGSLYALKTGFVDPDSGLGILVSVQLIITAALGGAGTLLGPLLGAAILIPLQTATNTWFGGSGSGLTYIIYGAIIVLIARFEPGGLLELWHHRVAPRLSKRRERRHAA